jgi:succinyl-CoA synthetase alpha subunit
MLELKIIAITEGIPVADMIKANSYVKERNARLIGPNCPGIITPGEESWYHARFCFQKGTVDCF